MRLVRIWRIKQIEEGGQLFWGGEGGGGLRRLTQVLQARPMFDFNTNKPQRLFFLQNASCIGKAQVILSGEGLFRTPYSLPLDPPPDHIARCNPNCGDQNFSLRNPESKFHWQGIWNPVVGEGRGGGYPDSKVIQCTGDTKPWSIIYNFLKLRGFANWKVIQNSRCIDNIYIDRH